MSTATPAVCAIRRAAIAITFCAMWGAPTLARTGNYLIITAQEFAGSAPLTELASARAADGFTVSTHVVTPGTTGTTLRSYIQSLWGTPDAPDYILLVGDTDGSTAQSDSLPHFDGGGPKGATTDLPYACMDGGDDWFPDIYLGRFPVRSTAQLQAIVDKTLYVEHGDYPSETYTKQIALLATDDSSSGAEDVHDWVAENYIEPNGYIANKIYASSGGNTSDIYDAINGGSLMAVYFGHSGSSGWWTPSFDQSDVRDLTNTGLYPLVFGFSCSTGHYEFDECYGETWIRTANRGAAAYISASTFIYWTQSPWHESQNLEKFFFESFFVDGVWEVGPAWQAALYRLADYYGDTDVVRDHFEMFNLFGDPALELPGGCSHAGTLQLNRSSFGCSALVQCEASDCDLNQDSNTIETVTIACTSGSEPDGEVVVLTETSTDSPDFVGTLQLDTVDNDGVLLVAHGDQLVATYIDADDGAGNYNVPVVFTATVDCVPPAVSSVAVSDIGSTTAVINLEVNEPVTTHVYYGLSCGQLYHNEKNLNYTTTPTVILTNLDQFTTHYFAVRVTDEAGNSAYDDNSGQCFSFKTLPGPTPLYTFTLDEDPGWSTTGQWEFGQPLGQGGSEHGHPDPNAGATGTNVYGVNLAGDYSTNPGGPYELTAGPFDLSLNNDVSLQFKRWLNTDFSTYVQASIEAYDGGDWYVVWENGSGSDVTDNSWVSCQYDLSDFFDGNNNVYVRWSYTVGTGAWAYSGWNIDDIEIWGTVPLADMNCDGVVNFDDINGFVLAVVGQSEYEAQYPGCRWLNADCNNDSAVNFDDIELFIELLVGTPD